MLISRTMKVKVCTLCGYVQYFEVFIQEDKQLHCRPSSRENTPLWATCCHYLVLGLVGATNIHHGVVDTVSSQLVVPVLSTHHGSEHKYALEYVSVMYEGLCNFECISLCIWMFDFSAFVYWCSSGDLKLWIFSLCWWVNWKCIVSVHK